MLRLKRSSLFWTLLMVTVMLPAGLLATKRLYQAQITDTTTGAGQGSSVIMMRPQGTEYMVRTFALPGNAVQQVWLAPSDDSWHMLLCSNLNGPTEDDCTYDGTGNVDISGPIGSAALIAAGISGRTFNDTLDAGNLAVMLTTATGSGGGYFVRIF